MKASVIPPDAQSQLSQNSSSTTSGSYKKKRLFYCVAAFSLVVVSTFHTTSSLWSLLIGGDTTKGTPSRTTPSPAAGGAGNNGGDNEIRKLVQSSTEAPAATDNGVTTSTSATANSNSSIQSTSTFTTDYDYDSRKHLLQEQVQKQQEMIQALQSTIQQEETSFGTDIERLVKLVSELSSSKAEAQQEISTMDDKLARDHDGWYGDTTVGTRNHNLNVTIKLNHPRVDRLGSNAGRPLYLYAYAQCKGYKFCITKGKEGVNKIFNFPSCPDDLEDFSPLQGKLLLGTQSPVKESGTYVFGAAKDFSDDFKLLDAVSELDETCTFSENFRQLWGNMILQASKDPSLNTTLTQENFFTTNSKTSTTTTTIAVNIRRGDVVGYKRPIWDEIYVQLIQQLRSVVEQTGKTPEVHVFSEDYGMIDPRRNIQMNWSLYDGLVDQFHLAPNMQSKRSRHKMDVSLNMRDWRHFVMADILVVGGTFADIPAYGRPSVPDSETGSRLTLYPCASKNQCNNSNKTYYVHSWTKENGGRMDQLELLNIPQFLAPLFAKSTAVASTADPLLEAAGKIKVQDVALATADGKKPHVSCLEIRGQRGTWEPFADGFEYPTPTDSGKGGKDEYVQVPSPDTPWPLPATRWRWQDEQCPVQIFDPEPFCAVLHRLGITRVFMVGDSLSLVMAVSLWKLLGGPPGFGSVYTWQINKAFPCTYQDKNSGRSVSYTLEFSFARNDHILVTPEVVPVGDSCNGRCRPWIQKYASNPAKTLLIANTGLHRCAGELQEVSKAHQGYINDFVEAVHNLNRTNDLVMYRTAVPGHKHCHTQPAPFSNYSHFEQHQSVQSKYDDYGWDRLDGFNQYVKNKFSSMNSIPLGDKAPPKGPHWHVLDVYPMTVLRPDGHLRPPKDCLHYALPGPPDWWNHLLYSNLLDIATPTSVKKHAIDAATTKDIAAGESEADISMIFSDATVAEREEVAKLMAAQLARDHDAWYSDVAGKVTPHKQNLNITIKLDRARIGQLESNLERPFYLFAYSKCQGYKFCIAKGREGNSKIFNFPSCPDNLEDFSLPKGQIFGRSKPLSESGTYSFGSNLEYSEDGELMKAIHQLDDKCTFSEDFRQLWRVMILQASKDPHLNTSVAQQDLFSGRESTVTIAVQIERGNAFLYKRLIWDEVYIKLLKKLRLGAEATGKMPEVHLFSEDYGIIDHQRNVPLNWSLYEGLVDHFHLVPNIQGKRSDTADASLSMRDWRHFVTADILVVGGTSGDIPAYGRPSLPDPESGSGLTLYPCPSRNQCSNSNRSHYVHGWTVNQDKMKSRMDKVELLVTGTSQVSSLAVAIAGTQISTLDEALVRDRDAWYGDLVGRESNNNLNVTIKLDRQRIDRLGSNVRRPFCLYAYAKCKGYKFCIVRGKEGFSKSLNFPTCPDNLEDFSPPKGLFMKRGQINPVKESGTYLFGSQHGGMDDKAVYQAVQELDSKCAFSDEFRQRWGDMIRQAPDDPGLNATQAQQDLFSESEKTTTSL